MSQKVESIPNDIGKISTWLHRTFSNDVSGMSTTQREQHNVVERLYDHAMELDSPHTYTVEITYGWVDVFDKQFKTHQPNYPIFVPIVDGYGAHVWLTLWIDGIPWIIDPNSPHPDYNGFMALCVTDGSRYYESHPNGSVETHPYTE